MKKLSFFLFLFPFLALPAYSQLPYASQYVNNNIKLYEKNPKWIKVYCGGMRSLNRKGVSIQSQYAYQLSAAVDPVVARHSADDYFAFTGYMSSNYCPDVW